MLEGNAVSAVEWEPLISTKIHAPQGKPASITRPRLLKRMAAAAERGVTLVSAPAGYGKTTLLRNWGNTRQEPTVWLSLDSRDNDSTRLGRYLAAACAAAGIRLESDGTASTIGQMVPSLINVLAESETTPAIILDDFHLIESPPIVQGFAFLIEHLPANVRLVIAGRIDPALPLARLRAHGQLSEVRSDVLRFNLEEMDEFLRERVGVALPLSQLLQLQERTEGWPAGLQLIAHLLRGERDRDRIIGSFSGDHPFVLEYLADEVMAGMPAATTQFLFETSILPEMDAGLCQAVTGRQDCQTVLEHLYADNLFLEPLDQSLARFRYHSLFRDLLHRRLMEVTSDSRRQLLHQRACQALLNRQRIHDAIPHAIQAGDLTLATELIAAQAQAAMNVGDAVSLQRWLTALPEEILRTHPQLAIWQAWSLTTSGHLDQVDAWLTLAEHAAAEAELDDIAGQATTIRSTMVRFGGDPEQAVNMATAALESLTDSRPILRSIAKLNLGHALLDSGRPQQAEQPLIEAAAEANAIGHRYVALSAQYHLGKTYLQRLKLDQAESTFRAAEWALRPSGEGGLLSVSHLGLALLALECDDLSAADRHLERAIHLSQLIDDYVFMREAQAALVRLHLARGERQRASAALVRLEEMLDRAADRSARWNHLQALKAEVELAAGDTHRARAWAWQTLEAASDGREELDATTLLAAIRIARSLSAERANQSTVETWVTLLRQVQDQARDGELSLLGLESKLMRASLLQALGRVEQAGQLLKETLAESPSRLIRPFLSAGEPMLALLHWSVGGDSDYRQAEHERTAALLEAFGRHGLGALRPADSRLAIAGLAEPLTDRESEVLALLAQGRTSREVAEELVIAFNTARTHIRNIYRKLDVHNRVEAVDRGRQFQLV